MTVKLVDWLVPISIVVILGIMIFRGKSPTESYQSWSRALRLNTCRNSSAFGEIGAVLMPAGAADRTPWFDYSHQYWDGRGPRSCDDCPGPEICPTCHNHGVSLEAGASPPGPLALGADPAVYEYMENTPTAYPNISEGYAAHILGAGAISGVLSGITNAITTEIIYNYKTIADKTKSVANGIISPFYGGEHLTVGADGGYVRGYGNICYGAPDDASPAAVNAIISPAIRDAGINGVNKSNNVGYTVMNATENFTEPGLDYYRFKAIGGLEYDAAPNYSSGLDPDHVTSREAMGACTTRRPLTSSLSRTTPTDEFEVIAENATDAAVERSLRSGVCNTVGKNACILGFVSRGTGNARKPELDRTNGHLRDSAIDFLYKEATTIGLADPHPAEDDCTFWGAYGRPYYEQC